jgi:predicted RNA-binding Zn ribbon-like protein
MRLRAHPRPSRFLFVGNHPSLDFINTEMMQDGQRIDLLRGVSDMVGWMQETGLLIPADARTASRRWDRSEGERIMRDVRAYRSTVRHMIERIVARRPVPDTALNATNAWLRQSAGYPQIVKSAGGFVRRYQRERQQAGHLLGVLAETVADILLTGDLSRIKRCKNDQCILYFYDSTKNQARRWCCMRLCGNRVKVAAHYRRQRRKR